MTSIRRRVLSRLRRRVRYLDAVGIRREPDSLTITVVVPPRTRLRPRLTSSDAAAVPVQVTRRGNVALLTIHTDDLVRAGTINRIVATAGRRAWTVGRAPDTDRPPVTMPATVLHVSGAHLVTTRLTDHKGVSRLHVMRWTA